MLLQHTTPARYLKSIRKHGLLASHSRGRRIAVWLHTPELAPWGFLHVVRRHGCRVQDVVSIQVEVPDSQLRKSGTPGLYWVPFDIPPGCFKGIIGFEQVSESPEKGG